jgi:hypothetical protein
MPPAMFCRVTLQRQPDGEGDCADGRDDRCGLHAELAEHHDHDQSEDDVSCYLGEELPQCVIEARQLAQTGEDGSLDQAGGEIAQNDKDKRPKDREGIGDHQCPDGVKSAADRRQRIVRSVLHSGGPPYSKFGETDGPPML